ncbi:MAG: hypothetical protein HDS22_06680 [Bacteroides sp.]|nr:hypothetical protein [Bacteroides sp.]
MKTSKLFAAAALLLLASCGGNNSKEATAEATQVAETAFIETQPVPSGQYRAVSYDITGKNPRKGKFDGRLLISLSPDQSGMYVYENGNRAKIDYKVVLKAPFEKGDSGVYKTVDVNDLPVTIAPDSTDYVLAFKKGETDIKIGFESEPMSTGTALEMMERISAMIQKNK